MRSWVIKARPDRNDFSRFPIRNRMDRWYTRRGLPRDWKKGDLLFIWAGAPKSRIIGFGRLTLVNAGDKNGYHHFGVQYLSNLIEGATIDELRGIPAIRSASFLKVGPSGTIYPLNSAQSGVLQRLVLPLLGMRFGINSGPETGDENLVMSRIGAGFGTPEDNRRVERAGIHAATRYLRKQG